MFSLSVAQGIQGLDLFQGDLILRRLDPVFGNGLGDDFGGIGFGFELNADA